MSEKNDKRGNYISIDAFRLVNHSCYNIYYREGWHSLKYLVLELNPLLVLREVTNTKKQVTDNVFGY